MTSTDTPPHLASHSQLVLPPVETTPLLLMRFTKRASPHLISLVRARLVEGGLHVVEQEQYPTDHVSNNDDEIYTYLTITAHATELLAEAQHMRLKKKTRDTHIMEYVRVSNVRQFCHAMDDDVSSSSSCSNAEARDARGLFSYNDWSLLVWSILDSIDVLPQGELSSNLSRALDGDRVLYRQQSSGGGRLYDHKSEGTVAHPTPPEAAERSDCLRHVLQAYQYCDMVTPLHLPHVRNYVWHQAWRHSFFPPVEMIRDYYGEEIAFYFGWMQFFTQWLCVPAVFGVIVYVARVYRGDTVDNDEYAAIFGLGCFVWAVLFSIFWERQEHRLAYRWGTFSPSDYQKQRYFTKRPEFRGELRISPVSGKREVYYPSYKRHLKMVFSGIVTCILLGVAFFVMILSLNVQGFIHPRTDPKRWTNDYPHPFHFPYLSALAEEGQMFDTSSQWRSYLPAILHVCCIFTMNLTYRAIAEWLTEWENHETHRTHRNSLILKRFLFEAFDCYVALFYLAFYERDVDRLRLELISIFNIDTFRRLALECILPMIVQRLTHPHPTNGRHKKNDSPTSSDKASVSTSRFVEEADLDEYEQFDDYMEIVIELGYVTLFAAAFPLASVIAIVSNLVEMHADCFKLTYLCRRPRSFRSDGLGMWKTLINAIIWLSALTNCLIFGFTSDQMMAFLPGFYVYEEDIDKTRLAPNQGWIVIFLIFALERFLVFLGLLLHATVPPIPEDVMDELQRRHWVRDQASKQWRDGDRQFRASSASLLGRSDISRITEEQIGEWRSQEQREELLMSFPSPIWPGRRSTTTATSTTRRRCMPPLDEDED